MLLWVQRPINGAIQLSKKSTKVRLTWHNVHRFINITSTLARKWSTSMVGICRLNYGSQIEEHHAVRQNVGMFDVSHMTIVDVTGPEAKAYLRRLLANDVAKLRKCQGKALSLVHRYVE